MVLTDKSCCHSDSCVVWFAVRFCYKRRTASHHPYSSFSWYCVPFGDKGRIKWNLFELGDSLGGKNDRQNVFLMHAQSLNRWKLRYTALTLCQNKERICTISELQQFPSLFLQMFIRGVSSSDHSVHSTLPQTDVQKELNSKDVQVCSVLPGYWQQLHCGF